MKMTCCSHSFELVWKGNPLSPRFGSSLFLMGHVFVATLSIFRWWLRPSFTLFLASSIKHRSSASGRCTLLRLATASRIVIVVLRRRKPTTTRAILEGRKSTLRSLTLFALRTDSRKDNWSIAARTTWTHLQTNFTIFFVTTTTGSIRTHLRCIFGIAWFLRIDLWSWKTNMFRSVWPQEDVKLWGTKKNKTSTRNKAGEPDLGCCFFFDNFDPFLSRGH